MSVIKHCTVFTCFIQSRHWGFPMLCTQAMLYTLLAVYLCCAPPAPSGNTEDHRPPVRAGLPTHSVLACEQSILPEISIFGPKSDKGSSHVWIDRSIFFGNMASTGCLHAVHTAHPLMSANLFGSILGGGLWGQTAGVWGGPAFKGVCAWSTHQVPLVGSVSVPSICMGAGVRGTLCPGQ